MQYHPDKTDNELLKQKFAEIKEAYEVLRDPIRRRDYDRTFDQFSYRRPVMLTPYQLLQQARNVREKTSRLDPHRADLDRIEFEITELLTEKNMQLLETTPEKALVQEFILTIAHAGQLLDPSRLSPIIGQLEPFADEETRAQLSELLKQHSRNKQWDRYKILLAIITGILLCLAIYLSA